MSGRTIKRCIKEVGFTQELCYESIAWPLIHFTRSANLLDATFAENHHLVGKTQALLLIMGHVDGGDAQVIHDAANFTPHFEAQFGVKIG